MTEVTFLNGDRDREEKIFWRNKAEQNGTVEMAEGF
jgi:hypothetical protein